MVAFGVAAGSDANSYKLAVRARTPFGLDLPPVEKILLATKENELDVSVTGNIRGPRRVVRLGLAMNSGMKERVRPLRSGHSVGHYSITAGTLGTFVKTKQGVMMLSNNHVLAASNMAKIGDAILQPGQYDGGNNPKDVVGKLVAFKEMKENGNVMDAAIASIDKEFLPKDFTIPHIGKIGKNIVSPADILGCKVQKTGRTTGHTQGEVTAINLRNVAVGYGSGKTYRFDNQMEVCTEGGEFSAGGDSGSFVVDMEGNPVALLFAGSPGHTIVCPIEAVLKEFKAEVLV